MGEYITKKDAINALLNKGQHSKRYKLGETWELNLFEIQEAIEQIPAADIKIENKELKRYLREAIAGFRKLGKALNDEGECDGDCKNCALNNGGNCYKWRLESEVLVLIDRM